MANYFKFVKEGAVAVLTFDRNEKRNPLNEDSVSELEADLIRARDDEEVRALLLTGAGSSFCAGADLSRLKGITDQTERQRLFASAPLRRRRLLHRTLNLLTHLEMPTVAAINGYAVGGGWFLALACDLRLAAETAEFWMPEADLGSPGPRAPEEWLTAQVGVARAKEIIFTCRHYKAPELYTWGMLNRVVKKEELMPAAMELAQSLAAKKHSAMVEAKAHINGFFLD